MNKVAFYISAPALGGVEKVFLTYANEMADIGYDVSFIMCHDAPLGNLISPKVKVVNFQLSRARKSIAPLRRLMKKEEYDVIVCSNVQTLFVIIARLGIKVKTKIVSSQHFYCSNVETPSYYKYLLRFIYSNCDLVLSVSEGIEGELRKVLHVSPDKVVILKNPINRKEILSLADENVSVPNGKLIVWVGRMYQVKNLPLLLTAFSKVLQVHDDASLILVGDGDCKQDLLNQCEELGISDRVIFEGIQTNPYKYLSKANVVALSSSSEAYPTVLLEALALGKTIVSTPTGGAKEILNDGQYGYLSEDFSVEKYAHAIEMALDQPMEPSLLVSESMNSDVMAVTLSFCRLLDSF